MKTWTKELNRPFTCSYIAKKTHEEMLNIPSHKGNVNQSHIKISLYTC
jgi:hypothetical protein